MAPHLSAAASPLELSTSLLLAARDRDPAATEATAAQLGGVDPVAIEGDPARIAFWLNVYNARLLHSLAARPRSGHLFRHRFMFRREGYELRGERYTLDVIEHGLLRGNARPPYSPRRTLRDGDPRLAAAPSAPDARIHFALNCGARSCPPVRAYSAERLDGELADATRSYLAAESSLDRDHDQLLLPGLVKLYRGDFGSREALVELAASNIGGADAAWIRKRGRSLKLGFTGFDWRLAAAATQR